MPPNENARPVLAHGTGESAEMEAAALTNLLDRIADLALLPEDVRHVWLVGYERGVESGIEIGRQQIADALAPAAGALAELRPSKSLDVKAAREYRARTLPKGQTPAQIRASVSSSWRRFEREIAEQGGRAS